ncbi:PREDICTED: uncharacterized protein LOC109340471 isoform X4 [Lupinus angustifolius]|uniref:uncharacterized protein LOC109340471 isoform X4 n=1 Tax=Lupinus angustifolius TaxID=3871 RepID=UPI00092F5151|nr:PREDICTED: uncharacterized protein LOC109340471 isoform X4 [Lupinus angustifolius]
MAASSKFDLSSRSPDRPLYTGQRGSHITASLDRSGSFRESIENPILSSLTNMSRSSSSATQEDVMSFFNYVRFDQKLVAPELKSNHQTDFKQHISAALGIPPDESPSTSAKSKQLLSPVPEDIKGIKDGLHANVRRGRERAKMFSEALSGFNKVFPSISSKKRSRAEGFSNDHSTFTSSDRSVLGQSIGKVGVQCHALTGGFEHEHQKSEERIKNVVPNKRTRTSLVDVRMDVRTNSVVRPSGTVDRDKEMLRIPSNGVFQGEERTLPIGGDGWEKSKMKKKRSGIKPDGSPSTAMMKPVNTSHETKQGMQQRLATDARSKFSNDSHSFRPVVGSSGVGKSDGISPQSGSSIRVSAPRIDQDNNSATNDRRDHPVNSDKEKVNIRAVNKATVRDDFNSASPNLNAKRKTSVRAPRSGSGVASKLSPVIHRAAVSNDWEMSHCTTKPPAGVGTNNRKRVASAQQSSPPVVPWQRPQKCSRTARRTNFVPIVSSNDDSPASDSVSDVAANDLGSGFARPTGGTSPQKIKLKGDSLSSAALSESEESGVAEIKPKEQGRKKEEIDQNAGQNVQKVSNLVLPTRKKKLVSGEKHGDGVRRQGRTGRSFPSTRSQIPVEKLGNIGTSKQLRSSRIGFEKSESKAGRPTSRKLSDRKAYARQRHTAISAAADFLVGSEDGHEELLAAVKGVINSAHAFSSPFWKQMEPFFSLINEEDITYWKQKRILESSGLMSAPVPSNIDYCQAVVSGFGLIACERGVGPGGQRGAGIVTEQLQVAKSDHNAIPLCQRLISALISDECCSQSEDLKFDTYDTEFETNGDLELSGLDHHSQANYPFTCHSAYNGYRTTGKPEHIETESDIVDIPPTGLNSRFVSSVNGFLHDKALMPSLTCSDSHYDALDLNDRLLLELQSIGISPELVPETQQADDEGICEDINSIEEHYLGQISKKKVLLDRLLRSASVTKELQERDFEHRALDKLVVMAYQRYMACCGRSSSGGKNSSSKVAKQAALGFVRRTLERCHQFEDTGMSCFNEPLFKGMFLAASSQLSIVRQLDGLEAESAKPYAASLSVEARTGNMDNHDLNSSDIHPAINNSSEKNNGKESLWSHRVKKRELSLDDVGGTIAPSGIGGSLSSCTKGKRSDRDRDGKGQSREVLSRNGTTKTGRSASSSAKGERKSKSKLKQKATQNSISVNGLLGKLSEQSKPLLSSVSESNEMSTNNNAKEKDKFGSGKLDDDHETIDLSGLQLPGMDVLGVPDDLDAQGQDLGSWLNFDDDGLQDNDCMGLQIPMDDLSDLNMNI